MPARRLAVAAIAACLALPAAALAQSAGDEQYVDPLGSGGGQTSPPSGGSGSSGGSSPGSPGSTSSGTSGATSSPAAGTAPATAGPGADTGTSAPAAELARTGADVRLVALAGVLLLLAGLGLRRGAHGRD